MNHRRILSVLIAAVLASTSILLGVEAAGAAVGKQYVSVRGPGGKKIGREVSAKVEVTNTSANASLTPERLNTIVLTSRAARFNSRAHRVSRCSAKLPNDGRAARCPSKSKIGSGSFKGIFGQPFAPINSLGVLSPVSGSIRLYNYKTHSGEQARILAVMRTSKPIAGVSINLIVPVTKSGKITINVPDVAGMPPAIPAALPAGSRFILTKMFVKVDSRKERRGRPFLSLKTTRTLDFRFQTFFE